MQKDNENCNLEDANITEDSHDAEQRNPEKLQTNIKNFNELFK